MSKEQEFVPLTQKESFLYVFVPVMHWHPATVLDPQHKSYYHNCNDAERQAIHKSCSSLTKGTNYPKYQGIYDPILILPNYIFGPKGIVAVLLTGNAFPENFLAKKDIYIITEEDKQLVKEFLAKNLSDKQRDNWSETDQFVHGLMNVTNKKRGEKGL